MAEIESLPVESIAAPDIILSQQDIVNAVERFDMAALTKLLPEQQVLLAEMGKIFTRFTDAGHNTFKALKGAPCSCMMKQEHVTVAFATIHDLASPGIAYLNQFAFVFVLDKDMNSYRFFQFCAHMDWKRKYVFDS